jgi:hypothetical protein
MIAIFDYLYHKILKRRNPGFQCCYTWVYCTHTSYALRTRNSTWSSCRVSWTPETPPSGPESQPGLTPIMWAVWVPGLPGSDSSVPVLETKLELGPIFGTGSLTRVGNWKWSKNRTQNQGSWFYCYVLKTLNPKLKPQILKPNAVWKP